MGLFASKIFGKFTSVFPIEYAGGYNGLFNQSNAQEGAVTTTCCEKTSFFTKKKNSPPGETAGTGFEPVFHHTCCDITKEDVARGDEYPEQSR